METTLNCREVMKILRVSRSTIREMIAHGELAGFQRGKLIRIDPRSVEQLLAGSYAPYSRERSEAPTSAS